MIQAEVNSVPFKLSPQPIGYKQLKPEHFPWANGKPQYEIIEPDAKTGYLSEKLFKTLSKDFDNRNTCIVNIGVGRGKTTTACDIIHNYASQEEYVVILASPFRKLVQRDHKHLLERKRVYNVVNYEILENEEVKIHELSSAQVHIITLNTLMLNPGEDNVEITKRKRYYCDSIQEYCRKHNKKVIFVFDEIHAGVHCFEEQFIFNLRAWKDITHKCFILSATFTEPARVAIEYIANLTDYKLHIVETERKKFPTQSNLHLYITNGKYSARDLSLLAPLEAIIAEAAEKKKRVHIVTAFKDLAEKLVDSDEIEHPLLQAISVLEPNLVTGDSKFDFDPATSNIGTTFYTGIDLKHEDDVLVLIMPSAESQFADKIGGIFTTGKVAISQAIARLRTKGDIHVFMPKSDLFIEGEYLEHVPLEIIGQKEKHPALSDEEQLNLLTEFYNSQRGPIEKEIKKAEAEIKGQDWNDRAPLNYPTLASFILNNGMNYLIQRFASYGKGFTPYVLWAALNDQFENTTLKSIYLVGHTTKRLNLQRKNLGEGLLEYYGGEEQIRELIKGKSFEQSYCTLIGQLAYRKLPEAAYGHRVKLHIDGVPFEFKNTPTAVKQATINILHSVVQGKQVNVDSDLWIRSQIAKYQDEDNWQLNTEPESKWYIKLEKTRKEFCSRVAKNKMVAGPELLDDNFLLECLEAVRGINKRDRFLVNRTFNFCRPTKTENAEEKDKKITLKQIKAGGKPIDKLKLKILHGYKRAFTKYEFDKKDTSKIDSFLLIPDKHFFPDAYKAPESRQRLNDRRNKSTILKNVKDMTKAELQAEFNDNNSNYLDMLLGFDVGRINFNEVAVRQKEIQLILGFNDDNNPIPNEKK